MPTSKRQLIVNAVKARFETILITGGFLTDIGARVFVWRDTRNMRPDEEEAEFINIMDTVCTSEASTVAVTKHEHALHFEIHVWTKAGTVDDTVRNMLADLISAVGVDDKWGGLARFTRPVSDTVGVEQANTRLAGVNFQFDVIYHTNRWNPYTADAP